MRSIQIMEEPDGQRRWVAVDAKTGKQVLRLRDCDQLRDICERLGWQVMSTTGAPFRSCDASDFVLLPVPGRFRHKRAPALAVYCSGGVPAIAGRTAPIPNG